MRSSTHQWGCSYIIMKFRAERPSTWCRVLTERTVCTWGGTCEWAALDCNDCVGLQSGGHELTRGAGSQARTCTRRQGWPALLCQPNTEKLELQFNSFPAHLVITTLNLNNCLAGILMLWMSSTLSLAPRFLLPTHIWKNRTKIWSTLSVLS